jgi:cobalt transporter subunit CbtB
MAKMHSLNADSVNGGLSSRICAGTAAILLGAFLLLGTGFAHSELLHDAAHDSRHGFTFPCH